MWGSLETSNAEDSLAAAVGWWLGEKILVAIATKNANYPMRRWLRFKIARNDSYQPCFNCLFEQHSKYQDNAVWPRLLQNISDLLESRLPLISYFQLEECTEMSSILVKACSMMGKIVPFGASSTNMGLELTDRKPSPTGDRPFPTSKKYAAC
ncbi:predicted protein [Botrytis cinerea T4]|uniref:Uncharacterized protein n=1 Tax=Botryotinia fuckeliana (strain T4) TaxID=999810 RepID=G2YNB5_BOTF4|nr:predicted protein [Botrytis cinerea T4]